jgi:hypothetical protein
MNKLKIAIDLDGTAWKHQEFFKDFIIGMRLLGHSIGIITAHSMNYLEKDLELWKARGFPDNVDFYYGKPEGLLIGEWKRHIMEKEKIDVLIDDFGGDNKDIMKSFFNEKPLNFIVLQVFPGED